MPRPKLFVIGAMKSGTTSLHGALGRHPSIFMCEPKEPSYFADREQLAKLWPERAGESCSHDLSAYLSLFDEAQSEQLCGESSTTYTKLPDVVGVAQRLHAFEPEARLVYMLRDPVERAISHYWHMVANHDERRPPAQALLEDPQYLVYSDYATQLEPWLECFPRNQLFVLTLEEFRRDERGTLAALFDWLDVSPSVLPEGETSSRDHVTPDTVVASRGIPLLEWLRRTTLWEALSPRLPNAVRALGREMADRSVQRSDIGLQAVREQLRLRVAPRVAVLESMLERRFDDWREH